MTLKSKKGVDFLIDEEDYDLVSKINWRVDVGGYLRGWCRDLKRDVRLHRLVMNVVNEKVLIDHKNQNPLDNRKCNLRICNNSENQKNKKASGKSKYLGVSIHTSKSKKILKSGEEKIYVSRPRFISHIKINGKYKHLGLFDNEIDAAIAYNKAALKYHGEFANLNIIKYR